MKKRVEAELISIAHRILKLKNKSEVDQLYKETQNLYETLTILKFYQDNFELVSSDLSAEELEEKLEQSNQPEKSNASSNEELPADEIAQNEHQAEAQAIASTEQFSEESTDQENELDENSEEVIEELKEHETIVLEEDQPTFTPIFELEIEEEEVAPEVVVAAAAVVPDEKPKALEDFLGESYTEPVFVKPNEVTLFPTESNDTKHDTPANDEQVKEAVDEVKLNPIVSKSIAIGLNDRIGFVQHLFNHSNEDFNRVISQLNTFDTFEEAKNFINEMVIPDYGYWVGEEDYMERFMTIVEKKFQ